MGAIGQVTAQRKKIFMMLLRKCYVRRIGRLGEIITMILHFVNDNVNVMIMLKRRRLWTAPELFFKARYLALSGEISEELKKREIRSELY